MTHYNNIPMSVSEWNKSKKWWNKIKRNCVAIVHLDNRYLCGKTWYAQLLNPDEKLQFLLDGMLNKVSSLKEKRINVEDLKKINRWRTVSTLKARSLVIQEITSSFQIQNTKDVYVLVRKPRKCVIGIAGIHESSFVRLIIVHKTSLTLFISFCPYVSRITVSCITNNIVDLIVVFGAYVLKKDGGQ
ncbi:hypothetical protein TNIN_129981 [Trichonephila inaurata madagascariensis]|uniref:Uncharacterized protein n=1 Tax=Trichonephila inaurata madagascariensis TaxID=2747483 RepID=A0A8X7BR62_9ARAC|nr:hypothetical protein TNIN_129981 [Trichonephila inaurata madagascariensis]